MAQVENSTEPYFEDLLKVLRSESDLKWALRSKDFPRYKLNELRTPADISSKVLHSSRVREAIDHMVAQDNKQSRAQIERHAQQIIAQMSHSYSLRTVRFLGYILKKLFQSMFLGIYVNGGQLKEIKELCRQAPVILMPTHRTYMDFLLVPFVFFHYQLPLPAIAAANDFLRMKFVSSLMRQCGAYFIERGRRDALYWAIFTEYVQSQLNNGDMPMMFFVEGTRSRAGKSLQPKLGMMSMLLEPFFQRSVFEVNIVPITITYSKVLEEVLYAYELLGFPKPPESTSGLMKARQVLQNTDLGNVFIKFGKPISCLNNFASIILETQLFRSTEPRFLYSLGSSEKAAVSDVATRIVKTYATDAVVPFWSLICCALLQDLVAADIGSGKLSVSFSQLAQKLELMMDVTEKLLSCDETLSSHEKRAKIFMSQPSVRDELRYWIRFHENLVELTTVASDGPAVLLKSVQTSAVRQRPDTVLPPDIVAFAVPVVLLGSYANLAIDALFVDLSAFCLCLMAYKEPLNDAALFEYYSWLRSLISREFIVVPGSETFLFDRVSQFVKRFLHLAQTPSINSINNNATIGNSSTAVPLFATMLKPFVCCYWVLCQALVFQQETDDCAMSERVLVKNTQLIASGMVRRGEMPAQILSTDCIKNGIQTLLLNSVLNKGDQKNGGENEPRTFNLDRALLFSFIERLECFLRPLFTSEVLPAVAFKAKL